MPCFVGAEPSTGEFGDGAEEGSVSCDGGDRMSCDGGGTERDGGLLMESPEASTSGAVSTGVGGTVKHQPVTFNPHGGSVLSLKVSLHIHVHCAIF